MTADSRQRLKLVSGREVSLDSLTQERVYTGLLEGLPTRKINESHIARILDAAHRADAWEPFLIEPAQRPIEFEGRHPFGEPAALPAICCVARLFSNAPARDPDMHVSSLTVVWFQDDYAFPISNEVADALHHLDWEQLACDGEY